MIFFKYVLLVSITLYLYIWNTYANINLTVSPIKYEIEASTWSTIVKTAILHNRSNETHKILTWKSDFQASTKTWKPSFVRKSELIFEWQELSSWIDINTDEFIIKPWEKRYIRFTINVPENATPWWHYWAVFFKNNNSEKSSWSQIDVNVDYGVLILVNVEWEIVTKWDVKETTIINEYLDVKYDTDKDKCFYDMSSSKYDWKCFDLFFKEDSKEDIDLESAYDEENNLFVTFKTLFINEWNTHLKPNWQIKLIDSDWKEIKWIWKIVIKNEWWVIIWEKIVDYLPINDNWGNVLPFTERIFESEWKWFPYEWYDENWKQIIKYWTPEEFYTKKNVEIRWFLLPWERVNEKINNKKLKADIQISYINKDWDTVEFSSAKEFYVNYKESYVWLNPYVFIFWSTIFILVFFLWLIFRKKKIICLNNNCKKKLDKDMKTCPYCSTKQSDKRFIQNKDFIVKKWKKEKTCINNECNNKIEKDIEICPYCNTKQDKTLFKQDKKRHKKDKKKHKKDKKNN